MIISLNSKRTPPPPQQGTFSLRFKIIGPLFAAFASALLLIACPSPGDSAEKACTGSARFTLKQNPGSSAANPTYTLTIADCVRIITPGEFAADPATAEDTTANTRLTALGASPTSKVTAIELPESLIRIERMAFAAHERVTGELTIPPLVESIGSAAFYRLGYQSASEQVNLNFAPNSKLKFIGSQAFQYARLREFPQLPRSLETVENDAFESAPHPEVSNFVIPENMKNMGNRALGTGGGQFQGTLTIESPNLERTPADTAQTRTGKLGDSIFFPNPPGLRRNPFTQIILHKTVFDSYTQADLNAIFGTGGRYVDIADRTTPLTK